MNLSESKISVIKWGMIKILVSEIHTIVFMKIKGKKTNGDSQIPFSLTTVSPCKNEWKIWMIVSLYYDYQKVRFNE